MKMTVCLGHHPIHVRKVLARRWAPPSRSSALSLQSPELGQIEAKSSKHHHAQARQHTAQQLQTHLHSSSWDSPSSEEEQAAAVGSPRGLEVPWPYTTDANPAKSHLKSPEEATPLFQLISWEQRRGKHGVKRRCASPARRRPGVQPDHPQVEPIIWGERRGPSRRAAASTAAPLSQSFEQRAKGSCCSY